MKTKEKLLQMLEENQGHYISGEDLAEVLEISRAAVWKSVNALREAGYVIEAATNKGYCLSAGTDVLSAAGIRKFLTPECKDLTVEVLGSVPSTNGLVREKASDGTKEGYVLIAQQQTRGRGRYGRRFYSPAGTGIYLSLLLRPRGYSAGEAMGITTMAAVAMCEAIEAISDKKPKIKWVNDIYIDDRKVCGILTEGAFDMENGQPEYAVLGVGINVYSPEKGFPEDLKSIAGAVFETPRAEMKNRLTGEFLSRFLAYYRRGSKEEYAEKYRRRSLVIGKKVTVLCANGQRKALALGIDDDCRLEVRFENGETDFLSYGEIAVRM